MPEPEEGGRLTFPSSGPCDVNQGDSHICLPSRFLMYREIDFEVIYVLIVKMQCSVINLDVRYVERPIFVKTVWVETVGPPRLLWTYQQLIRFKVT